METPDHGWAEGPGGTKVLEPAYTPDMATEIEGPEESQVTGDMEVLGKVLGEVLGYVLVSQYGHPVDLAAAFKRFVCVAWAIRPDLLGGKPLSSFAPQFNVTRQDLSKIVRKFCDEYGIRNAFMKRESTRATYSKAQKEGHWRRRPKRKPGTPPEVPGDERIVKNSQTEAVT